MNVSNCCGTPDRALYEDGPDYSDLDRCPSCKEHCEFVPEDIGNPLINSIKNRLAKKERQLTGLLLIHGSEHPETVRVRDEIMALENELEECHAN